MNHRNLFALLFCLGAASAAIGQTLLRWSTDDILGGEPSPSTLLSVENTAGIEPSTLSMGPGLVPRAVNDSKRFQGETWQGSSLETGLAAGDYFEFTITPGEGMAFTITKFDIVSRNRGGSTGARVIDLVWDQDDYTTVLASYVLPSGNDGLDAFNLNNPVGGVVDVAGAATFRLVAYAQDPDTFDSAVGESGGWGFVLK